MAKGQCEQTASMPTLQWWTHRRDVFIIQSELGISKFVPSGVLVVTDPSYEGMDALGSSALGDLLQTTYPVGCGFPEVVFQMCCTESYSEAGHVFRLSWRAQGGS